MTTAATTPIPTASDSLPARLEPDGQVVRRAEPVATRVDEGRPTDPRWARPALLALLAATALLYLWNLSSSGYANTFYSAAVQAGSHSWKAFFFGSSDASNFITVDKPPASLWVMDISARIFGVNSWSILVPQALEGVASVGLLYATVRRWYGAGAGLIAGAVLALTPVAVLMFRFNNPDSLLVLLLIGSAYAVTRAIETGRTRWLVLAGVLIGTGFITKMLQAFLVVPGFALVFLVAAPTPLRKRLIVLLASGVALVAASLWWVVVVMAVPAADRPYIGGSQNNSLWNLIFGYNGFGRITGNENGSVVGGGQQGTSGMWGPTGLNRMFNGQFGGQISWLIPAALILTVGALALSWRAVRTDRIRAGVLLWATWLIVTGLTFSLASGIIHPYYSVALAPAIGALVGIGSVVLWRSRAETVARVALALAAGATGVWAFILLDRSAHWLPWLRYLVLMGSLVVALVTLGMPVLSRRVAAVLAAVGVLAGLGGPAAYAMNTARSAHTGSIPTAGPASANSSFGGRGGFGGFRANRGAAGFGILGGAPGAAVPGSAGRFGAPGGTGTGGGTRRGFGGFVGGRGGGLLDGSTPAAALTKALKANASSYTWVAAVSGSNSAAGYQLAAGAPVMAIGGFNGTDPAPSLAQFETYVAAGKIHYYVSGGRGGFGSSSTTSVSSQIATWVEAHYTSSTIGGETVYDLTSTGTGGATSS